ncbi:MAG TPA: O-antigen ligase family protein [Thermosynergistes sp.]|nr:O-antigen ligase family protein [Thermosynergistes sp.]
MTPRADKGESTLCSSRRYVFLCFFVSLALPNIVFSGDFWFQTLHLMKWVFALVPIAVLCVVAGYRLFKYGHEELNFFLDPFGVLWLVLLLFVSLQPFWAPIKSPLTFIREWFFFSALWAAYLLFYHSFCNEYLMPIVLGGSLNAALNVVFAELQLSGLNSPFPFIVPASGNYIGNTGQQNMLALWVACGLLGGIYVFLKILNLRGEISKRLYRSIFALNLVLFLVNSWGLWSSTSRSGLLALASGSLALLFLTKRCFDRKGFMCVVLCCLMFLCMSVPVYYINKERLELLSHKVSEVGLAGRKSIWATSWTMFSQKPLSGVGLGHFKWNYLEAQRLMFERFPDMEWKYTLWAHNEVLQWLCETGIVGGAFLIGMAAWWLLNLRRAVKESREISLEAIWAVGMLFLFWMNAQWTRPFHRIEDAIWMSLAFALANREILPQTSSWATVNRVYVFKLLGAAMALVAVLGLLFLFDGLAGDRALALATKTSDFELKKGYLEKALRSPLVSDLAERQLVYLLIEAAEITKSEDDMEKAIAVLRNYFYKEPQARDLKKLIELYARIDDTESLKEMAWYLKPGLYRIEPREHASDTSCAPLVHVGLLCSLESAP